MEKLIEKIKTIDYLKNSGCLHRVIIETVEKSIIADVLKYAEGNQLKAAEILGINRNTLRSKIRKLNIRIEEFR